MDRGVLEGVLVVQRRKRGLCRQTMRPLAALGVQLAPIVGEARTEGQFVATVHRRLAAIARNLYWCWDSESSRASSRSDPVLWQWCHHNTIALPSRSTCTSSKCARTQPALHGRINDAARRLQEYLHSKHTWGARNASVLGRGRLSTSRRVRAGTSRCRSTPGGLWNPRGRPSEERVRPRHPARRHRPVYDEGYLRQRLDPDLWQHEEVHQTITSFSCRWSRRWRGEP